MQRQKYKHTCGGSEHQHVMEINSLTAKATICVAVIVEKKHGGVGPGRAPPTPSPLAIYLHNYCEFPLQ